MRWHGRQILSPLTKGGNLPFRRLCVEFGAEITVSEMAYARQVQRRSRSEMALLRHHPTEQEFGVQIAAGKPADAVAAAKIAVDRGAVFVDLNCGCPIHDVVRRGMGATLLQRERTIEQIVKALVAAVPVPVTVKIRTGFSEGKVNAPLVARIVEEAGASALTLHGRTREQRYQRAADWDLIARIVSERTIPVIGNGDILTFYEARERQYRSDCASVMVARGALIKPWIFTELREQRDLTPGAEERLAIYHRLARHMLEHFGDDDLGRRRAMTFLPWHFSFFCRYRPLPEQRYGPSSLQHPLLQTRIDDADLSAPLDAMLADPRSVLHEQLASLLLSAPDLEAVMAGARELARSLPPSPDADAPEFQVSHG